MNDDEEDDDDEDVALDDCVVALDEESDAAAPLLERELLARVALDSSASRCSAMRPWIRASTSLRSFSRAA